MKSMRTLLVAAILFLILFSGCVRFKPYSSTIYISGFTHPISKVYKGTGIQKGHFSYVPSSGALNSNGYQYDEYKKNGI